jgi:hypothetical protein
MSAAGDWTGTYRERASAKPPAPRNAGSRFTASTRRSAASTSLSKAASMTVWPAPSGPMPR